MPRLNKFKVRVETGNKGMQEPVRFSFNSHLLPLEDISGGTQPGEVFEGGYEVRSVAHSMALVGPDKGMEALELIAFKRQAEKRKKESHECNKRLLWSDLNKRKNTDIQETYPQNLKSISR